MEDLMHTPNRENQSVLQRGSAGKTSKSKSSRYKHSAGGGSIGTNNHTGGGIMPVSSIPKQQQMAMQHQNNIMNPLLASSGGMRSYSNSPMQPSRLQTEEEGVDGAQAIENESDQTDEDEQAQAIVTASGTNFYQHQQQHTYRQQDIEEEKAISQRNIMFHMPLSGGAQYNHENSSFGMKQDAQQSAATERRRDADSISNNLMMEEPRRDRAMRHASYKNLFTKNSAFQGGDQDGSSILSIEQENILPPQTATASKAIVRAGSALQPTPQVAQPGLSLSRSQLNFQYLISEEELPGAYEQDHSNLNNPDNHNQQQIYTTDDEIFDQDGGQDGTASNYVDMDEVEDISNPQLLVNESPSPQHMTQAMINFRRTRPTQQQSLSQYGGGQSWVVQEPHIDEELSDAEQDNSSENNNDNNSDVHSQHKFITYPNIDEQIAEYQDDYDETSKNDRSEDVIEDEDSDVLNMGARERAMKIVGRPQVQAMWSPDDSDVDALFQETIIETETPDQITKKPNRKQEKTTGSGIYSSKFSKQLTQSRTQKNTPGDIGKLSQGGKNASTIPRGSTDSALRKKQTSIQKSRVKPQGSSIGSVQKVSSFDFSQSALQVKRPVYTEENSNQDILHQTFKTLKQEGTNRTTPRSQPITNFQLQQEQAKLMRYKQMNQSQKMNKTAFGSSQMHQGKPAGGNNANNSQQATNVSQTVSNFHSDKNQNRQQIVLSTGTKERGRNSHNVTRPVMLQASLNHHNQSSTSMQKPLQSGSKSKYGAPKSSNINHTFDQRVVGSSSSKKQQNSHSSRGGATAAKSSSIFITAKQSSHSATNGKHHVPQKSIGGTNIKPFTLGDLQQNDGGKSCSLLLTHNVSPGKQRGKQIATTQMSSAMSTVTYDQHPSLSKTAKQQKEKTKSSAHMITKQNQSSSSILQGHIRQLNNNPHQQSLTNLQSISSQFKDNHKGSRHSTNETAVKANDANQWNTQNTPNYAAGSKFSTISNSNFAKPTASSKSNSHSAQATLVPKSSSHVVKDTSGSSSAFGGYPSHTAARSTAKRGGFFRDNGGAIPPSSVTGQVSSLKSSVAQLPSEYKNSSIDVTSLKEQQSKLTIQQQRTSSYKGTTTKKTSTKQPAYSKGKRNSIVGYQNNAYMTTEVSISSKAHPSLMTKIHESSTASILLTNGNVRPPSSSKNSEAYVSIQGGPKRQRTNTTMGLQSNKHTSMRQSMNNLTLQDVMAQQMVPVHSSKPAVIKGSTNRGTTTEKNIGSSILGGSSFSGQVSSFKSSSLLKSSTNATRKSTTLGTSSNHLSQVASKQALVSQVNDRVELLASKQATVPSSTAKKGFMAIGSKSQKATTGAYKLRSQSGLKHTNGGGTSTTNSGGVSNGGVKNFTSQQSEQISKKRGNQQHQIIMATVESKTAADVVKSYRGGPSQTAGGSRSTTESKRASIHASKEWGLADFEKVQYGDRCPKGFEKISLLGKGGCAVVWLARDIHTGRKVALKQFPKPKGQSASAGALDPTAKIEIEMGKLLFSDNTNISHDGYSINPSEFPGILKIARLYAVIEEPKDFWLSYQVGGKCLTNHLFDVKGEFYKGERIYGVQHQDFYRALKEDKQVIVDLIRMLAEVLDVLAMFRIVHADLKPDNILIDFDGRRLKDVKLIDFGSAFSYENPSSISATTPEYLAPEVLDYLEKRGQNTDSNGMNSTNLCRRQEPWSYDMWSMGAILLEMLTGIPLWMSLKCRAQTQTGKQLFGMGIFGVQGRQGKKILQKQATSFKNLQSTLKKYDCYGLDKDPVFMDLLVKMLDPNPITRISPIEVLEHPYIKDKHGSALASTN